MRGHLAHRTDSNHAEISEALRKVGATVHDTHTVGAGYPDIHVLFRGQAFMLEIKSDAKKALTKSERDFHRDWVGHVHVVCSPEEALRTIGAIA
jgi:hypothetical protein